MITASGIGRVKACPASDAFPQVNSTSVYADRGISIHGFLASVKRIGREAALELVPEGEWRDVCAAIDLEKLPVALMAEAAYVYDTHTGKARFIGCNINRAYGDVQPWEIAGTADVVGIDGSTGYVADYFSGFAEMNKDAQLRFLALCLASVHGLDEVIIDAIRIRPDGTPWTERQTLDALDLAEIAGEVARLPAAVDLVRATINAGRVPDVSEGAHCRYCPAVNVCPAKTSLLRIAAGGGDVTVPFLQGGLTRDMVGSAYVLAEQLDALTKELRKRIHGAIAEFGEVPTPRGTVLRKVLTEGNERVDGDALYQIVSAMCGVDVAEKAVERRATKTQLGKALREAFGRDGASKERDVLAAARDAGAVTRSAFEKLVELDVKGKRRAG